METTENKAVVYEFGKFVLDPHDKTLVADGVEIHVPVKEFDTLLLLVENNGRVVTKDEMLAAIWHDAFVEETNVAKQISRLRKLLGSHGEEYIETLPKRGYRFSAELRRTVFESEDAIILEKRTVKRVKFAVENEFRPEVPALPPARRPLLTVPRLTLFLVALIGLSFLTWQYGRLLFAAKAAVVDPYAPLRLTDNPNDDTGPSWTRDGHIRFARVYPDNRSETWIMDPDGKDQILVKDPEGKHITAWSPDEQKFIFQKTDDPTKWFLSNADGTAEITLPSRSAVWSPDSKMLVYHQKVSGENWDIFTQSLDAGEIRNISNNKDFDADPSFSPDGKKVIFSSNRDGNAELYSTNLDGSDLRRLTNDPAVDSHGSFSPDGTQILFTSNRENENADVYLMHTDGTDPLKLTNWDKSNESAGPGCWSPDGTKIVFWTDRNGKDDIYVVSAETVRPKIVVSDSEHDLGVPAYSPDGKKVVYSRETENRSGELRVLDLETGVSSLVAKTEMPLSTAHWSPDGSRIAFSDRSNGNSEVFLIKPDGSDLQDLTNDPSQDVGPSWSPDGKYIAFLSGRGAQAGVLQLYMMNADGRDPHPITPRKGWEGDPVWSPDGNAIIFSCDRGDSPGNMLDICQIQTDGSGEERIVFHREHDTHPVISPDGKRIAFNAHSDGNYEIYLMNRDGSGLLRLTRDPADDLWPEWSPDGTKLIFGSDRSGKFGIYEVEVP